MRAVHSKAPCSPCRNCDSVQFWLSQPELHPLGFGPVLEGGAGDVDVEASGAHQLLVGDDDRFLVDLGVPGQVGLGVPLGRLGLLVEPVEAGPGPLVVVPGEEGVVVRVDPVVDGAVIVVADRQDGFEIVDRRLGRSVGRWSRVTSITSAAPDVSRRLC